jgi:hypothetical protein
MIDTVPTIELPTVILLQKLLPKIDVILHDNDTLIDQLSDRYEESRLIQGNGKRQF